MIAKVFENMAQDIRSPLLSCRRRADPIPGATQMLFSDLGTPFVAEARGFSAYLSAREKLIASRTLQSENGFMLGALISTETEEDSSSAGRQG